MKRFLLRCAAYAVALSAMAFAYVYGVDPLRVMRWYDDYFADGAITNIAVAGVENFERNPDRRRLDSFIFGSSVSKNLLACEWKRYLPDSARVYHFSTDGQAVPATRIMLEYAVRNVDSVRHIIVMAGSGFLRENCAHGQAFELHPAVHPGLLSRLNGWRRFFVWSLSHKVAASRLELAMNDRLGLKYRHWLYRREGTLYDPDINEQLVSGYAADSLSRDPGFYDGTRRMCASYRFMVAKPKITPKVEADLRAIADIARGSGATLDVIVSMDEIPSAHDDSILYDVFGSGYHNLTTAFVSERQNPFNYYDEAHFFPEMTTRLLDEALSARQRPAE